MSKKIIAAAALAAAALPASAQGFYADAGYTFVNIDYDVAGQSGEIDLGAVGGHVGYDFNEWFALEGEAAVGVSDEEASIAGVNAKLELNYIVGAFARANLPINEQFRLYGRVGAVNAEVEGSATGGGFNFAESSSDSGVGYGAGAELMVSSQFGVRGDYTRYDIEDIEADAFTVAAVFKF
ncbi:porin family protein [Thalassovita mediterranea]|jgi:outer membrane immunogenic protein|nr:porin family protein [Thalassovita mediterranea]